MNRHKRLLFITDAFPPQAIGGIGRYCYEYGRALAQLSDYEIHIFTPGSLYQERLCEGMTVHEIPTEEYPAYQLLSDLNIPYGMKNYLHSMLHYATLLDDQKPIDLILAPTWNSLALPFVRSNIAPTITVPVTGYHEMYSPDVLAKLDESEQQRIKNMLAAETALFHEAQYIQWSCAGIQKHMQQRLASRRDDFTSYIIPFGFENQAKPKQTCNSTSIEILFVGRLEHRKGIDLVLESFVQLASRYPRIHLRIIGGDTAVPYRERFLKDHAGQALLSQITFEGRIDDTGLMEAYRRADIFIAPSRFESFGLIYIEAMMHGLPIIALHEHQHIVLDGQQGLLAQADATAVAGALELLIKHASLRETLGKCSQETFALHYDLKKVVSRLTTTYNAIIEHSSMHTAR